MMTSKEVIEELKILKEDYWEDDGYGYATAECQEAITALDMAIEALEQQPCEDAISRKAVLNKLNKLIEVERLQGTDEMGYGRERVSAYESMIFEIENKYLYPSVNPQQPCDDCISRQAVIKLLSYDWANRPAHKAVESIRNLPSVTPKEKTGKWIYDEKSRVYRCSCCNRFPWRVKLEKHDEIFTDLTRTNAYKFCPNCGAKMVEPQESEDKEVSDGTS